MIIRTAEPEELDAVAELVVAVYVGGGLVSAGSGYVHELADAARRAKEAELLVAVAEPDGGLLGTITYCAGETPYAEIAGRGEADFRMLAVDAAAREAGVGEALVRACIDRARAEGRTALRLSTKDTMHAAHRLYERLGFYRTPELDWSPDPAVELRTYALDL